MLIDELSKANIEALKARDQVARAIYSVIIAKYKALTIELKAEGKEATDADLVKVITKSIKELDEEKESYAKAGRSLEVQNIATQKALIEKYLPKLMSEEEIKNKGFGQYADGEVYECFSLTEIPLNKDQEKYRTIIFNGYEYELIKCSPFGVNKGSNFDGYYDIYFGRRSTTQGGMENA